MTTTQGTEDVERCPFCGSNIEAASLGRLGLSVNELHLVAKHARDGTLKDVLTVAEIALRRLDPEKMSTEFQVNEAMSKLREVSDSTIKAFMKETTDFISAICQGKEADKIRLVKEYEQKYQPMIEALQKDILNRSKDIERIERSNQMQYSELNQGIKEIKEKIIGTGIGNVSEMVTIRELKEVVPTDSFSEARATKGGTDIIAVVKENATVCGTITISNKCTQKWESQFLSQINRDMKDDGSRFGILVTKAFPREALSSKAWVVDVEEGKTVILVKPEYASVCYFGMREALIHWFETRKILKRKEEESDESDKTFKALMMWINGEEFEDAIRHIDDAKKATEETRNQVVLMRNYINIQLEKVTKFQNSIEHNLMYTKGLVGKLRELLNSGSPEIFT